MRKLHEFRGQIPAELLMLVVSFLTRTQLPTYPHPAPRVSSTPHSFPKPNPIHLLTRPQTHAKIWSRSWCILENLCSYLNDSPNDGECQLPSSMKTRVYLAFLCRASSVANREFLARSLSARHCFDCFDRDPNSSMLAEQEELIGILKILWPNSCPAQSVHSTCH